MTVGRGLFGYGHMTLTARACNVRPMLEPPRSLAVMQPQGIAYDNPDHCGHAANACKWNCWDSA